MVKKVKKTLDKAPTESPSRATQYTKDKVARLSFRVNQSLYDWVSNRAKQMGLSPCDMARTILTNQMSTEIMLKEVGR